MPMTCTPKKVQKNFLVTSLSLKVKNSFTVSGVCPKLARENITAAIIIAIILCKRIKNQHSQFWHLEQQFCYFGIRFLNHGQQ